MLAFHKVLFLIGWILFFLQMEGAEAQPEEGDASTMDGAEAQPEEGDEGIAADNQRKEEDDDAIVADILNRNDKDKDNELTFEELLFEFGFDGSDADETDNKKKLRTVLAGMFQKVNINDDAKLNKEEILEIRKEFLKLLTGHEDYNEILSEKEEL